jgi:hypothetical protein
MLHYNKALRLLLYPQLTSAASNMTHVKHCAEACGHICQTYKRLYSCSKAVFSHAALQSVFSAGLTILYCIWVRPAEVLTMVNNNNLACCSTVLCNITESWPEARKYRDAFEHTKRSILQLVAEGRQGRKHPAFDAPSQDPLILEETREPCEFEGVMQEDTPRITGSMSSSRLGGAWPGGARDGKRDARRMVHEDDSESDDVGRMLKNAGQPLCHGGWGIAVGGDLMEAINIPEVEFFERLDVHGGMGWSPSTALAFFGDCEMGQEIRGRC